MPWPIVVPTGTRTNVTPHVNTHPDDHNKIAAALTNLSSVENASGRIFRIAGGPYSTTKYHNVGALLPNFPFAGTVIMTAQLFMGLGTGYEAGYAYQIDMYTDGVSSPAPTAWGYLVESELQPALNGVWQMVGPLSLIAPVSLDNSKPSLVLRTKTGGTTYYTDGYVAVQYMPGAIFPGSTITPT